MNSILFHVKLNWKLHLLPVIHDLECIDDDCIDLILSGHVSASLSCYPLSCMFVLLSSQLDWEKLQDSSMQEKLTRGSS